jgi:acetyl esterase
MPGSPASPAAIGPPEDRRSESTARIGAGYPSGRALGPRERRVQPGPYLPTTPWTEPLASPIYGDLSAYPPAFLTAGTHDPIVDSAKAFVELLDGHGVAAVRLWPEGMPHGYYFFPGVHPEGDVAFQKVRGFLAEHLA